jgi:hypothetical protein
MAPPLLAREGSTYLKGTKLKRKPHYTGLEGFPGAERWLRLPEGAALRGVPLDRA